MMPKTHERYRRGSNEGFITGLVNAMRLRQIDQMSAGLPEFKSSDGIVEVVKQETGCRVTIWHDDPSSPILGLTVIDITRETEQGGFVGIIAKRSDSDDGHGLDSDTFNSFTPDANSLGLGKVIESLRIAVEAAEHR
jgi:hypothetical protein